MIVVLSQALLRDLAYSRHSIQQFLYTNHMASNYRHVLMGF
jgi:hypothetical protein